MLSHFHLETFGPQSGKSIYNRTNLEVPTRIILETAVDYDKQRLLTRAARLAA